MSYTRINSFNRVFAMILAVLMIVAMVPVYVFAGEEASSVLTTDIGTKNFTVGKATEFTFTTIANDDAGEMVKGSFVFSDPSAIEKLEYRESKDGNWYPLTGDFGPETGFPMKDATSTFRATFNKEGEYTVTVSMKTVPVDGGESSVLCSVTEAVKATHVKGELETDIGNKVFAVNEPTEFTFSTVANSDAGTMVYGMADFENKDAISKLEYFEVKDGKWYEFAGNFGPETGFPMMDATSKFRVTFSEVGEYAFNAYVKNAADDTELCSTSVTAKVEYVASEITTDIKDVNFVVGNPIEFTFTTDANSDLGKPVFGIASFSDESVIDKLEYYEVANDKWYEFDGKFGPEGGFPMADATSKFRVTFNKVGNYSVEVYMKDAADGETVLCSTTADVVVEAAYASVDTYTGGEVINNASNKVDVVIEETVLQWAPKDESIGRYQDGWWVGIKITAPKGFSANAKYQVKTNPKAAYGEAKSFVEYADDAVEGYISIWFPVSPESLTKFANEGRDLVMTYGFNWDGDAENTIEQEIVFTVKPSEKIVLMKGDKQAYPFATVETLTGGSVTANGSASVEVLVDETTLQWAPKDESIGRYQDGWWVGIKVTAPEGFSADAKYVRKGNRTADYVYDEANIVYFESVKDGADYVTLWFPISPETLVAFQEKGYDPTLCYNFDWDNDGTYEQEIFFAVKRDGNIVLNKGDVQKYPDVTAPKVDVSWTGLDDDGIVKDTVIATVTITERNESFDAEKATEAVINAITTADGGTFSVSEWEFIESTTGDLDDDMHKATVTFAMQGTYNFEITEYADTENNFAAEYPAVCDFVIDKTAPRGDIKIGEKSILNSLWNAITFNIFNNEPIEITIDYKDDFTGIEAENVYYFISGNTDVFDEEEIANLRLAWAKYDENAKPKIAPNAIARVYVMLVDNAGNAKYLNSRGVIAENIGGKQGIKIELPGATSTYKSAITESDVYVYNASAKDYSINLSVNEYLNVDDISSGIKKITYWFNIGDEQIEDTFVEITDEFTSDAEYDDLVKIWNGSVEINRDWNSSDVSFWLMVEDNAGNVYSDVVHIDIDVAAPVIDVQVNGIYTNEGHKLALENYFESATAKVTITERENHFDEEAATEAVMNGIVAVDNEGNVADAFESIEWVKNPGETPDDTTFVAEIVFVKNANYTINISYADTVGNVGTSEEKAFCIDTTDPVADIIVGEKTIIRKIIDTLTFHVFDKNAIKVEVTFSDVLSGIQKAIVYKSGSTEDVDASEIVEIDEKDAQDGKVTFDISPDEIASFYLLIVDKAGNEITVDSQGIIVENDESSIVIDPQGNAGEYSANMDADEDNETVYYYNSESENYNVDISVDDVVSNNDITSGIANIKYWFNIGDQMYGTLEEVFPGEGATYDELQKTWNTTVNIKDALGEDWNSSGIALWVMVEDNAGNVASDVIYIDIDATESTVKVDINGVYTTDDEHELALENYFESATATVIITERENHFDEEAATQAVIDGIVVLDGKGKPVADAFSISGWEKQTGATPDDTTYTAEIKFLKDADYTVNVSYEDKLGNIGVSEEKVFCIDTIRPVVNIDDAEGSIIRDIINTLTFHLFDDETITVEVTFSDELSGLQQVIVNRSESTDDVDANEIIEEDVTADEDGKVTFDVKADEIASFYVFAVDKAGNEITVDSQGIIVENDESSIVIDPQGEAGEYSANMDADEEDETVYYYNNKSENYDVNISVDDTVSDNGITSGIASIEYWFNIGDQMYGNLNEVFPGEGATYDELQKTWNTTVNIKDALGEDWNSSGISLWVMVKDNAGNVASDVIYIDVDATIPTINVSYEDTLNDHPGADGTPVEGYFAERIATIVITERTNHFDALKATEAISILVEEGEIANYEIVKQLDADGNEVEWITVEGETPDDATHTAIIKYTDDGETEDDGIGANYTFDIVYTDFVGNTDANDNKAEFTVDTTDPTGKAIAEDFGVWDTLLEVLTFGIWTPNKVTVTAEADDATSDIYAIHTYTQNLAGNEKAPLTFNELEALEDWANYEDGVDVTPDACVSVYFRITDNAGNYIYVNTDGIIVDNTVCDIDITPEKPDAEVDGIPTYMARDDKKVDVAVKVTEDDGASGINTVTYTIESVLNGVKETDTIYTADHSANPAYDDLDLVFEDVIEVDAEKFNACDVLLTIEAIDNAGNKSTKTQRLDIDVVAPVISVEYTTNDQNDRALGGYYTAREAVVTIVERNHHFDPVEATKHIVITAKDADGKDVADAYTIGEWRTILAEGDSQDADVHSVVVTFVKDANYTLYVEYTDMAGNVGETTDTDVFTVDTTVATGTITVAGTDDEKDWSVTREDLIAGDAFNFELWSRVPVLVTGTADDATSPVQSVMYYKTDLTAALDADELAALDDSAWSEFNDGFTVAPDEQFTVYVRLIDNAGNISYISTNGVIADSIAPVVRDVLPVITVTPQQQPVNGIYSTDVKVDVKVTESKFNEVYSGLKNIRYEVYNMGVLTQSESLYDYNKDNDGAAKENLVTEWIKNAAIIVDKNKNNSNDVEIRVYARDNAGNEHFKSAFVKIDVTAPVIDITYDNEECIKSYNESMYFDADRTATIVITERNFDPADVIVTITNTDGVIPVITGFTKATADGNGDGTTHTATISYTADGDYTFEISYKDEAGLDAREITHHSVASEKFTIDKTLPVVEITYDNNSYENGMYYAAARTAFIKVTEHNFDPARFIPTTVAQGMSQWVHNGDVHTAMISFTTDGDYTLGYELSDKAANDAADFTAHRFIIDTVKPEVTIIDNVKNTQPEDRGAYNGDVNFTIVYSDIYVNSNRVDVELKDSNGKDYTFNIENGKIEGNTVEKYFIDTLENDILPDGIYTLTVTVYDMAGNGTPVKKIFSVNRDSSNFVMDLYLGELVENKYNKEVDKDITISEINCDKITSTEITIIHNGETKVLKEAEDYTVEHKIYGGDWNQYDYTIFAENFAKDGNYSIVIKSSDEAGNTVDNLTATDDFKKVIDFSVDDTAPILVVNGLDEDSDQTKVTAFITYEDNICVDKVIISVVLRDRNDTVTGDSREYVIEGEELSSLSDRIEHIINQAKYKQDITIKVIDKAGNVSEEVLKSITINPNWWIRFVNNTPVFVSSICAVVVLVAAAIIIPVILKKKKEKKN